MTSAGRIQRLSPRVVGKIAAGEMIDRPVAVVKELVENALDAGATRITVQVEGSLDRLLTVIDDGVGMTDDEVRLAVERHATSKIRDVDDLFRLHTLGFRGEALAAIGAVSALTITTLSRDAADGTVPATQLEMVGGELLEVRETSRTAGTTIEVRDLFFNVPVRRKFLKTERGELRVAMRLISHLALAHPGVRLAFDRVGTSSMAYEATDDLRTRVGDVYGRDTARRMLDVDGGRDPVHVTGLVGAPDQSRATRDFQVTIVNGRPVVSPLLNHAIKLGYGDLIPPDRHPMAVLHLAVDPGEVDVNVHPTKREVKFAKEGLVFEAVRRAVADALSALAPARPAEPVWTSDRVREPGASAGSPPGARPTGRGPDDADRTGERGLTASDGQQLWLGGTVPRADRPPSTEAVLGFQAPSAPVRPGADDPDRTRSVARPDEPKFWQLHKRYIFAQTGSGVIVIDQHAAHERILYERGMARLEGTPATTQQLLIPEQLELTSSEEELLEELLPELRKLGFEIDPFGPRTILVRAIPDDIHAWDKGQLLRDLLDEYVHAGRSVRAVRERLARAFACRGAIKSGTSLAPEEMRALIDALFATETPHGDPHGRATLIQMSLDELDRRFGRS